MSITLSPNKSKNTGTAAGVFWNNAVGGGDEAVCPVPPHDRIEPQCLNSGQFRTVRITDWTAWVSPGICVM